MKILLKFQDVKYGWNGLRIVWREESHFAFQIALAVGALIVGWLLDAEPFEMIVLFAACTIALGAEIINTAIEDVCNKIEPNFDPQIGAIKDIAQAYVIVSALPTAAILTWLAYDFFL